MTKSSLGIELLENLRFIMVDCCIDVKVELFLIKITSLMGLG